MAKKNAKPAFTLSSSIVKQRFGDYIDLGLALVSQDLNVLTLRGSAPLTNLSVISGPDTFDDILNPSGTQRELKLWHAEECYDYAIGATGISMLEEPRAFPEIMLNLSDLSLVEFFNPHDDSEQYEFASAMSEDDVPVKIMAIRVLTDTLNLPKPMFKPQISRIDGNHRLSGMDTNLEKFFNRELSEEDIPTVPYSFFVGLKSRQELRLFFTVNKKHEGMDAALTDAQQHALADPEKLKTDPELQPLWLTRELRQEGRAFYGVVDPGGSKLGMKQNDLRPVLKSNTLRGALTIMLREGKGEANDLRVNPQLLLLAFDNYWKAVKHVFKEAWHDKTHFILLQSIGLNGFAALGGDCIRRAVQDTNLDEPFFRAILQPIKSRVSLDRKDKLWSGVAGAGGAKKVYETLSSALSETQSNVHELEERYLIAPSVDDDIASLGK